MNKQELQPWNPILFWQWWNILNIKFCQFIPNFQLPLYSEDTICILYPKLLSSKFCFVYLLYLANSSWRDLNTKLPQMNIWIWYEGNTKVNLYQEQISEYLPADSIPSLLFKLAGNPRASKATWQSGGKGKKDQLALSGNKSRSF